MRVALGRLTRLGLEASSTGSIETAAKAAVVNFAEKLAAGRAPLPPPRFLAGQPSPQAPRVVELELDDASEHTLLREAQRHGVGLDEIGIHAVMVYLAEREALEQSIGGAALS